MEGGDGEADYGDDGGEEEGGKRPCQPQQLRQSPFKNDAAERETEDEKESEA